MRMCFFFCVMSNINSFFSIYTVIEKLVHRRNKKVNQNLICSRKFKYIIMHFYKWPWTWFSISNCHFWASADQHKAHLTINDEMIESIIASILAYPSMTFTGMNSALKVYIYICFFMHIHYQSKKLRVSSTMVSASLLRRHTTLLL